MGFWRDVRELRDATQANLKAGRGSRSLVEAVQERSVAAKPPARKEKSHRKTFLISFLFGVLWQSTRRR